MLAHSFLKCGRSISPSIRRRTIWRIHSCKACGFWSIPSKLLAVAVLVRPTAGLLREAHTAAWRLLAVLAGHETLLLEPTARAATPVRWESHRITGCGWRRLTRSRKRIESSVHVRNRISLLVFLTSLSGGGNFSCGCRSHYSFLRLFTAFQP